MDGIRLGLGVEDRRQELIQGIGIDAGDGRLLVDQSLFHHLHGDPQGGEGRAFPAAGLEHPEFSPLEGEFDILHIFKVPLQPLINLFQLLVGLGEGLLHGKKGRVGLAGLADRLRGADSGHHILSLSIGQEFAEEDPLSCSRVTGEGNARGALSTHIAEDHGLNIYRGTPVPGDLVELPVGNRPRSIPGFKDRSDGPPELFFRVLGEFFAGLLLYNCFEFRDQVAPVFCRELKVQLHSLLLFSLRDPLLHLVPADSQHHVAVHLDETAVGVVSKTGIAGFLDQPFDRFIIDPQVQDGVHHPGHGDPGAGADGKEQGILRIAEFRPHDFLHLGQSLLDLFAQSGWIFLFVVVIDVADLGGNGEPGGNRDLQVGHLREVTSFSAKEVAHFAAPLRFSSAKEVNIPFRHFSSFSFFI